MLQFTNFTLGIFIGFITLICTIRLTKYLMNRLKRYGFTAKDMYKARLPKIPTMGGLAILAGLMISIVMTQVLVNAIDISKFLIFYMVIVIFGTFGLIDDLINIGRKIKVVAPFFMALPMALITIDTNISILSYTIELGWIYAYLFAPIYVMVVANLINMHAGYNGLEAGLSIIIIGFISLKLAIIGPLKLLFYVIPLFFTLLGFYWYNKYPSKIFMGNVGTTVVGAGIGAMLVFFNMEFFGIVILMPHIINFLLWIFWSGFLMKLYPKKYPHIKFGKLRVDGKIDVPNYLTIKYAVTKLFGVREKATVWICYGLTVVFGVVGLVWF
jgi:UDP-N-acetylglucosamine--dolichyl-phosphate N-acetylglucosaminephosphotransferase